MKLIWDSKKELDLDADEFYGALEDFLYTKAEGTQKGYTSVLSQFAEYLGYHWEDEGVARAFLHVRPKIVFKYIRHLGEKVGYSSRVDGVDEHLAASTVKFNIILLRTFYNHLRELKFIKDNPWPKKLPRYLNKPIEKQPTRLVPFEKVREMLTVPNQKTPEGLRDYLMLALLFGCGLRAAELQRLKIGHFKHETDGSLYISMLKTKGDKLEDKAIPDFIQNALEKYLDLRESDGAKGASHLLVKYDRHYNVTGEITYKIILLRFKKYIAAVGLNPDDYTPHAARATAITKLLSDGYSHREVQDFSGHQSIRTVERYDKRAFNVRDSIGKKLEY